MQYNLIAWKLNSNPEPILICDTWVLEPLESLKFTMGSKEKERPTRAIVIDFATNKIIYEAKTTIDGYFIDIYNDSSTFPTREYVINHKHTFKADLRNPLLKTCVCGTSKSKQK